jgi:phosphoribosylformylglycinamidine synthase
MHDGCRDEFAAFFKRKDTFALGVCNGCQMMSALKSIIPGAEHWPRFRAQQGRAVRSPFRDGRILESPSIFFAGMAGSQVPIVVSHGEGRAVFDNADDQAKVLSAVRYVDNKGEPTKSIRTTRTVRRAA